jgi:hypothetical protein
MEPQWQHPEDMEDMKEMTKMRTMKLQVQLVLALQCLYLRA